VAAITSIVVRGDHRVAGRNAVVEACRSCVIMRTVWQMAAHAVESASAACRLNRN
jgi:hypothetical protein